MVTVSGRLVRFPNLFFGVYKYKYKYTIQLGNLTTWPLLVARWWISILGQLKLTSPSNYLMIIIIIIIVITRKRIFLLCLIDCANMRCENNECALLERSNSISCWSKLGPMTTRLWTFIAATIGQHELPMVTEFKYFNIQPVTQLCSKKWASVARITLSCVTLSWMRRV